MTFTATYKLIEGRVKKFRQLAADDLFTLRKIDDEKIPVSIKKDGFSIYKKLETPDEHRNNAVRLKCGGHRVRIPDEASVITVEPATPRPVRLPQNKEK